MQPKKQVKAEKPRPKKDLKSLMIKTVMKVIADYQRTEENIDVSVRLTDVMKDVKCELNKL
jgi:hypothetical protein